MKSQLSKVSQTLIQVALGEKPADLVLKQGTLVNVITGELNENVDVAISGNRIAYVGNADHTIGPDTEVIELNGKYLAPGLMDGHMHVESTMLTVTEFARMALTKGTTSIFMDPHEMANVFGKEGVRYMHEEGQKLPLHVFTTFPSCVPSTADLEDAGASITVEDVEEGLTWDGVVGLGEMMNFPGIVNRDPLMIGVVNATIDAGKTVTGHFPDGTDQMLQAYLVSGADSCHETINREKALEKLRLGMYLMIREGSAWHDVKELAKVITIDKVNTEQIMLVTDDIYPQTLVEKGQVNHVVRRAIEEGVDPVTAIKLASINTARYFKLADDYGSVSPRKVADIIILDELETMEPTLVIADGKIVAQDGKLIIDLPTYEYPAHVKDSVHVKRAVEASDFIIKTDATTDRVTANVIEVIENSARTKRTQFELKVESDQTIVTDLDQDVIKLACLDRHHKSGDISVAFAHGFKLKKGAVASTVAHDSHNLIVMGTNDEDMAFAANYLVELGGGMVVVEDGKVLAEVPLPVAGLMSDQRAEVVVEQVEKLEQAWKDLGCPIHAPFMTFSLIALPVIPDIRITNRGLVDVVKFDFIPVIE
ncbi:adenine deaminase [Amphibacillus xylanus]|uniref:Adenine deaminase n=1 Tax=Amphibacillus xylanus (strain ATCC 51415 / DSM 6626 / JCM 7361 / LMG 17667 / NBRC 15112 / Ep01) TaxID=698758 RepID=K0J0C5_AMPXN|nr:adenine deaminase [Amphibacillus xylanus]BAM48264.1 adenine deaminase [Amphibacillus xylanus NBRC 15112]